MWIIYATFFLTRTKIYRAYLILPCVLNSLVRTCFVLMWLQHAPWFTLLVIHDLNVPWPWIWSFEDCALKRFGEEVGQHCTCWAVLNLNVTTIHSVLHKKISHQCVLSSQCKNSVRSFPSWWHCGCLDTGSCSWCCNLDVVGNSLTICDKGGTH